MENRDKMQSVQGLMVYLCSLANGLELLLGRGSESICFRSGRTVGMRWKVEKHTKDLIEGMGVVKDEMLRMGINWPLSPYKKSTEASLIQEDGGRKEIKLAIENCIVRCTLARYGWPQKGSLCNTKHGLFCGLFDQVCGTKSTMDIIHAGENGCMLRLKIHG